MSTPAPPRLPVRTRLPRVWPGYVVALVFTLIASGEILVDPTAAERQTLLTYLTWLVGIAYWLFCVHRFHRVLAESTGGSHPISPGRAAGFHLIPFFNLYWIFRWTNAVADLVGARITRARVRHGWTGVLLLAAFVVSRFDAGFGLLLVFAVIHVIRRDIRRATEPGT
jgi:hypothetical protein